MSEMRLGPVLTNQKFEHDGCRGGAAGHAAAKLPTQDASLASASPDYS